MDRPAGLMSQVTCWTVWDYGQRGQRYISLRKLGLSAPGSVLWDIWSKLDVIAGSLRKLANETLTCTVVVLYICTILEGQRSFDVCAGATLYMCTYLSLKRARGAEKCFLRRWQCLHGKALCATKDPYDLSFTSSLFLGERCSLFDSSHVRFAMGLF